QDRGQVAPVGGEGVRGGFGGRADRQVLVDGVEGAHGRRRLGGGVGGGAHRVQDGSRRWGARRCPPLRTGRTRRGRGLLLCFYLIGGWDGAGMGGGMGGGAVGHSAVARAGGGGMPVRR